MKRLHFYPVVLLSLLFLLGACAGRVWAPKKSIWYYHKELPEADRAIEEARQGGKDTECPEEFDAVTKMRDDAYETYWACRTEEAIEKAKAARDRANALCPAAPVILDSDGDGVFDNWDQCPDTPRGVKVGANGCPLDSDGDGVPDYLDQCPDTPRGVKVDANGCPRVSPLDSDGDGVLDNLDQCPGTPMGVRVDAKGCPLDTDRDGVYDYLDQCLGTPRGAEVDSRGCWVIRGIQFDTNKWDIKAMHHLELDQVVEVLKRNPFLKVEIQGHTDNQGARGYNQKLSEKRARSVMEYFIQKGIDPDRLSAEGYGLTKPIATNATSAGRAMNRRVELTPIR